MEGNLLPFYLTQPLPLTLDAVLGLSTNKREKNRAPDERVGGSQTSRTERMRKAIISHQPSTPVLSALLRTDAGS